MADYSQDTDDRALAQLFAGDPVPDDGFSVRVVRRIQRRQWLRRLLVPGAVAVGALIAAKPASILLTAAFGNLMKFGVSFAPALQPGPAIAAAAIPGLFLLFVLVGTLQMLED